MPRRQDVESVLLIGSGPIMIGQAAEFDFSGSQACRSLREEGIRVVLVNSNPATIMTDPEMADKVYIEPLTPDAVARIVRRETPDGIVAGLGGQTGLNITAALAEMGVLEENGVKMLGTPLEAIQRSEDRQLFKDTMEAIGEPVPQSRAVGSVEGALELVDALGFPLIIRPAYTLGGAGGGVARNEQELTDTVELGLKRSRINQVLVEESVLGWKEFEYEVMRDARDTCITVCNMENIDPMGIHTGDSIVVTPSQTLTDEEHQMLRSAALKIIRALKIEGGCNIQFAVRDGEYSIIEVNPRVSRSSALASKATGYPIARVSAKIAIGLMLDEIINDVTKKTPASFEPTIDYTVVKIPRWPFDKFTTADCTLTTSMKSTGEVMAIGRTIEEALMKAIRSLDTGQRLGDCKLDPEGTEELLTTPTHERLLAIYRALELGFSVDRIASLSGIDPFFVQKIENIYRMDKALKERKLTGELLRCAKRMAFLDERIARLTGLTREKVHSLRRARSITPTYKMVDTCAAEFEAATPYYYSSYEDECEAAPTDRKKVLILGSGPIRIGQGIEFDYCTVHAVSALREEGIETHIINNNPETVSTDYDTSDNLFFEPLTLEDVMSVIERERPYGVMVQFGGQTSVNLAIPLERELSRLKDIPTIILGTSPESMDVAEDRKRFNALLSSLDIPQPEAGMAMSREEALAVASSIGYPVLVRPSYVLGGRAMEIVYDEVELERYIDEAVRVSPAHPILVDKFLKDAVEIDVDAVCDCNDVLIGAIMEHIEEAGIHSGDSACVIPPQSLPEEVIQTVKTYVEKIALALNVVGIINIQMAYKPREAKVYVLEANPRSSRTIPYVSKAVGIPLAKIAAKVMVGHTLKEMGLTRVEAPGCISVKEVVLPFDKLPGADTILSPEMRSTGEVMGVDYDFGIAFYKAELAAGNPLPLEGSVFISVRDEDKSEVIGVARKLADVGLKLIATAGTARFLEEHGMDVELLKKVSDGHPNVVDLMRRGQVQLVINTPTSKVSVKDGYEMRRAAVDMDIPYVTTIQAARATAMAIVAVQEGKDSIKPITEYLG